MKYFDHIKIFEKFIIRNIIKSISQKVKSIDQLLIAL